MNRTSSTLCKKIPLCFYRHLEGREEEVYEELGDTQAAGGRGGLVRQEDEDHLVDPQQGDEGQSGLGQPAVGEEEEEGTR